MLSSLRHSLRRVPRHSHQTKSFSSLSAWANVHPDEISSQNTHKLQNFVGGKWTDVQDYWGLVDPLKGGTMMHMPDTKITELSPFMESLNKVPKSGLHNPYKNPERYVMYGEVSYKAAEMLSIPEVEEYFIKCIQKVMPKSHTQAYNEVHVSRIFLKNFAGDSVRFMSRGFSVSGDRVGQTSNGLRWPFGRTALICPFNFPFEIPVLQLMGSLFMGNKLLVKGSEKTSFVLEQYIRLLLHCGMPAEDLDLIHCHGETMQHLLLNGGIRVTQFTGSSKIAEHLCKETNGKVRIEDAGFDWKILGPDASKENLDFIAYTCDQDAYSMSGQKCSAQSMLFMHENYEKLGLVDKLKQIASKRSLKENTISPVLSVTTKEIQDHIEKILKLPGANLLFGEPLSEKEDHTIPECYGAQTPTAVHVPLSSILSSEEAFNLCTTEIFGPFQIITTYNDEELPKVLAVCEKMSHHLTAAVVSNDQKFLHNVLGNTVNGTSYAGLCARTTGAPANHWFGPSGDPRGAGIGTPEAIRLVWSAHREVVTDYLVPEGFSLDTALQS